MISGEYLAAKTIAHLCPTIDKLGTKQYSGVFKRTSKDSVCLKGIHFSFKADKNQLEIRVEKEDIENFSDKIKFIKNHEFWKNPSLKHLKEKKEMYSQYISFLNMTEQENGNFYFNSRINTHNEEKLFFAVMNCIIRPVLYSLSEV